MKKTNFEFFKYINKKKKLILIISILFFVSSTLVFYSGYKYQNKKLPKAISMNDLITDTLEDEDVYSYIDINTTPFLFATYEINGKADLNKFYFVMDSSNFLYIVYMDEDKFLELTKEDLKSKPIRIYGLTKKIDKNIIPLAIDAYNEEMGSEYLTNENFSKYVGLIYLDMTEKLYDATLYYVVAISLFILFIIFFIKYLITISKSTLKKYTDEEIYMINTEIMMLKNNPYLNMHLYLLKDYLVDTSNGILIINYKEICGIKKIEKQHNGLVLNNYIKIIDKNNKTYNICNTKYLNKDKDLILNEVINKISSKNLEINVGSLKKEKIKSKKNRNV